MKIGDAMWRAKRWQRRNHKNGCAYPYPRLPHHDPHVEMARRFLTRMGFEDCLEVIHPVMKP